MYSVFQFFMFRYTYVVIRKYFADKIGVGCFWYLS